jgi:dTDP-4-dehydrorhamnose reductase
LKRVNRLPRIVVLGEHGQLAWELQRSLAPLGEVIVVGRRTRPWAADLARPQELGSLIEALRPDWIVNAAAYTDVDGAEREPELARAVNGTAPGALAEAARRCGALLVHFSTDYVFDGTAVKPYDEGAATNPVNCYGQSKREGEINIMGVANAYVILRTSWLYANRGRNFVRAIRQLAREREQFDVVADQRGAPTWARHVAEATAQIVVQMGLVRDCWPERSGIYHLSAGGETSRHGFATRIVEHLCRQETVAACTLRPVATRDLHSPARRPAYSVLDNGKLRREFNIALPHWEAAFAQAQQELAAERI